MADIAIVDYGMGNLRCVFKAVELMGGDPLITSDPKEVEKCNKLILPGVGAFPDAMKNLSERGLVDALNASVHKNKKPFLGICLGFQLLAEVSYENTETSGLGWFPAEVKKFSFEAKKLKVPHVGWNDVSLDKSCPLFKNFKEDAVFYFVHSYYFDCKENIIATCEYGHKFVAGVQKDNIYGVQFHPEKSQSAGLAVLENFIDI